MYMLIDHSCVLRDLFFKGTSTENNSRDKSCERSIKEGKDKSQKIKQGQEVQGETLENDPEDNMKGKGLKKQEKGREDKVHPQGHELDNEKGHDDDTIELSDGDEKSIRKDHKNKAKRGSK